MKSYPESENSGYPKLAVKHSFPGLFIINRATDIFFMLLAALFATAFVFELFRG